MSELLLTPNKTGSLKQSDVNFEVGFEYRTVVTTNSSTTLNLTLQRMNESSITMMLSGGSSNQNLSSYYTYKTCSYLEYRSDWAECSTCPEQQFTMWFGQEYCYKCSDYTV